MNDFLIDLIQHPYFIKAMEILIAVVLVKLFVQLSSKALATRIEDKDLRYKSRKLLGLLGYAAMLVIAMIIFNEQMSNITVIIGALGVGVGFALREVIQSFMGWIAVSFWGLYKPGERIQIGGIMGDVIDISPLNTTVMECGGWVKGDLYNGRLVRVSNSVVFKDPVINYSSDFPFLWDEIVIQIRTDSDHRMARRIVEEAASQGVGTISVDAKNSWTHFAQHYRVEDAKLEPMVTMSFDANWLELTLRYVVDYRARRSTKDKLFTLILDGVEASQGRVQVASASFQITEFPEVSWPGKKGDLNG